MYERRPAKPASCFWSRVRWSVENRKNVPVIVGTITCQIPNSSDNRTSDSSRISSRQVKQGKGKRSTGIAQTSPTDDSSNAGPPHSLWISTSIKLPSSPVGETAQGVEDY